MTNFKIPLSILTALLGAAIGLITIFPQVLIVIVLMVAGFAVGKVLETPEMLRKVKEFFSLE